MPAAVRGHPPTLAISTFTQTDAMSSIFSPPASCQSHWTYEPAELNHFPEGLLIQNALHRASDPDCFPPNFSGHGTAYTQQVYSPGACPIGYTIATLGRLHSITSFAICCQVGFALQHYSDPAITPAGDSGAGPPLLTACSSTLRPTVAAAVPAFTGARDLTATLVTGNIMMWAQPVNVMWQSSDLVLFPKFPDYADPDADATAPPTAPAPGATSRLAASTATSLSVLSFSGSPRSTPPQSNSGLSPTKFLCIGIGLGISAGILPSIILGLIIWRRRVRTRRKPGYGRSKRPAKMRVPELDGDRLRYEMDGVRARCELEVCEQAQELAPGPKGSSAASPVELDGSEQIPQIHLRRQSSDLAELINARMVLLL
ncbi:hypothetical protein B0J12DRAFT_124118 [Macrophomina phaseolina]|uniref:Uncharacterized protein n=1 Tax=Macrophomina phaseolina TaxID=35725 RepID=A0ABQ8GAT9_9PEZI|nr:hypothetical protein B0J12DRAFT_124118 [Macrophomina phaseolina]